MSSSAVFLSLAEAYRARALTTPQPAAQAVFLSLAREFEREADLARVAERLDAYRRRGTVAAGEPAATLGA